MKKPSELSKLFLGSLLDVFYPRTCCCCENLLLTHEEQICLICLSDIPITNFHLIPGNMLENTFWGRVPIFAAASLFFYNKESKYSKILHEIKYRGNKKLALIMGELTGKIVNNSAFYDADLLIPVPLHKKKKRQRGYNQSELIARGISKMTNIELDTKSLVRVKHISSQTKKGRVNRWQSIQGAFEVSDSTNLEGKHVVIVDDVITTGATIEACAEALINANVEKISIVSLGFAANLQ